MQSLSAVRVLSRRSCLARCQHRTYSDSASSVVKPYYVTTPIFYPNAAPHIGHLHSLVIADIFARHARLSNPGREVHFITGTDEHGLKIQNAAKAGGMEPLAFCDELSEHFRNLTRKANVSNSCFMRTTERQHRDAVQHLWKELDAKGLIYKGSHAGWYSVSDETFYPTMQVAKQEQDGEEYYISTTSGSRVEWQEEENYKFRLSAFRESLSSHFAAHPDAIYPPQHHADIMAALQEPLEDLSVSRKRARLAWGIPVPNDPEHTVYVWIDALTVYLSSVGYPWNSTGGDGSGHGWPPNVQVIGKDILRFHAIYFPAMLQALGLPLTQRLLSHSHWTVDRAKMSKSVGNVADPIKAIDDYGIDLVRYYLARVGGRFKDDVDWSQEQLQKHSREIISLLGNLFMRATSSMMMRKVSKVKRPNVTTISESIAFSPLLSALKTLALTVDGNIQRCQVADAVDAIVLALHEANLLMTQAAPWSKETSETVAAEVQMLVLEALRQSAILLQPVMPDKTTVLLDSLGVSPTQRTLADAGFGRRRIGSVRMGVRLFDLDMSKL
ncbi:tRNA synthetases class I (M)-domain-containing protein [Daedaleopsis nitida]|nr:tRNA synthetases class I (M)-domain-containing protein [Daedaleopsis nitida]